MYAALIYTKTSKPRKVDFFPEISIIFRKTFVNLYAFVYPGWMRTKEFRFPRNFDVPLVFKIRLTANTANFGGHAVFCVAYGNGCRMLRVHFFVSGPS